MGGTFVPRDLIFRSVILSFVIFSTYMYDLSTDYYQPFTYHHWNLYFISEAFYVIFLRKRYPVFKWIYILTSFLSTLTVGMFLSELDIYDNDFTVLSNSQGVAHNFPRISPSISVTTSNTNPADQVVTGYALNFVAAAIVLSFKILELLFYMYVLTCGKNAWNIGIFSYELRDEPTKVSSNYQWYRRLNFLASVTLVLIMIQGLVGFVLGSIVGGMMFTDVTNPTATMALLVIVVSFQGGSGAPFSKAHPGSFRERLNGQYNTPGVSAHVRALLDNKDPFLWNIFFPVLYFIFWVILLVLAIFPYLIRGNQGFMPGTTCASNSTSSYYIRMESELTTTGWYKHSQTIQISALDSENYFDLVSSMLTYTCMDEIFTWLVVILSLFVFLVYLKIMQQRKAAWKYINAVLADNYRDKPVTEMEGDKLSETSREDLLSVLNTLIIQHTDLENVPLKEPEETVKKEPEILL